MIEFLPERYEDCKAQVDFEKNLFASFPKLEAYFLKIKAKGLKVSNTQNSWIAYAMGISDEKPTGRITIDKPSVPDIDMDFSDREPVVQYIFETYGEEHTAAVGTFQTIKTKFALKDIVRYQNGGHLSSDDPVHKITAKIPTAPQSFSSEKDFLKGFTDKLGIRFPGHLEENKELRDYLARNPDTNEMLFKILEKPRSAGQHAGGILITPEPIDQKIPTRYFQGRKCTQIGHKTVEDVGGMKIDILGVNTLNWIAGAVKLIKERHGIEIDPWNLKEDPDVFKMIASGDVETMFQFDTDTVKPFLKKIRPTRIHDLILTTSICRPGALDSKLADGGTVADHWVARHRHEEPVDLIDPILGPILSDTYGLVVFQEQIQKIFEVVGGFHPIAADSARKAVGKKDAALINSLQAQLFTGALKHPGWDLKKCDELWQSFIGAANYSFNRSHACAYAIIAYACAYLKKRYPLEWWCSVLSYVDAEKVRDYQEIIAPFMEYPTISTPTSKWIIRDTKIVAPISLVRSVGENAVAEIAKQHAIAPFTDFVEFYLRVNKRAANKTAILNLILAGCFDGLPLRDGEAPCSDMASFINLLHELREEEVPAELTNIDRMRRIELKNQALTISAFNLMREFRDIVEAVPGYCKIDGFPAIGSTPILANYSLFSQYNNARPGWDVGIIGMITDVKSFTYVDKKTKAKVTALRVSVTNDGRVQELVLWPDTLLKVNKLDFTIGKLVLIFGGLKYSNFKGELGFEYKTHKILL